MSLLDLVEKKMQEENRPKTLLELVEIKLRQDKAKNGTLDPTTFTEAHKVERSTDVVLSLLDQVQASRLPYARKESIFLEYISKHRAHQNKAIEGTRLKDKGQIIIPTGTGKTRIQIHLHIESMLEKLKKNETGVYIIGAHRLLLCKQLMDELQDLCLKMGIPINALYVGSARYDEKDIYDQYFEHGIDKDTYESMYTTTSDDVKTFYEKTLEAKRHLIVVSTYHSFNKLKVIGGIDLCTYDEAHTTTEERFMDNIIEVIDTIKRNYFFTATRKVYGEDGGMNDEQVYGDIIITVPPTEMIDAGEITMPRIHTINLLSGKSGEVSQRNEIMLVNTIIEAFVKHKEMLKSESASPDDIGSKLLVSTKGSSELDLIQNNLVFQKWCADNNIKTFSYSSRYGSFMDFKQQVNRGKVYENMRNLDDKEDAILLHIDILTEGIDLPSITGVLLLRHLNEIKLFQALGRALRLFRSDRKRLYSGEITSKDRSRFIKPYAYLILPMHFEDMDESSFEMKQTLQRVIGNYGIPTEEFLPPEQFDGITYDYLDPVTHRSALEGKSKMFPLTHAMLDLVINKFTDTLPTDPAEKYKAILALIKKLGDIENA